MKTMTCRALGGPCDIEHRGESADDVITAQDRHLKQGWLGRSTAASTRSCASTDTAEPSASSGWNGS